MNRPRASEGALDRALGSKLRELLGSVEWLDGWSVKDSPTADRGFDLVAKVPTGDGESAVMLVQCKSDPRPSQFPYAHVASERKQPPVLVFAAPFISPRMAETCKEAGWSWYDLAGNCRISVPGLLYMERTGIAPVHQPPKPVANLGTPEASRIIRALLAPENAKRTFWTQRAMQQETHPPVSLGLVNKVVRHLREEAFVEESRDGGFRLSDPLKLLFAWRDAYRFERHERQSYFTLLKGNELRGALAKLGAQVGGHAVYAAFSAADFQAPHVRQPKTWLYVRANDVPKFERLVEAKPVDSGGNLVVLIPEDEGVFYSPEGGAIGDGQMACTNVVQTYVDLWHCGGRGQEAAEAILEQRLRPEWVGRKLPQ